MCLGKNIAALPRTYFWLWTFLKKLPRSKGRRRYPLTRSFILQLWAKDLEPSIFSQCLFFIKAKGRFQSVRSASSSSPSPKRGDCSISDSMSGGGGGGAVGWGRQRQQQGILGSGEASFQAGFFPSFSTCVRADHQELLNLGFVLFRHRGERGCYCWYLKGSGKLLNYTVRSPLPGGTPSPNPKLYTSCFRNVPPTFLDGNGPGRPGECVSPSELP